MFFKLLSFSFVIYLDHHVSFRCKGMESEFKKNFKKKKSREYKSTQIILGSRNKDAVRYKKEECHEAFVKLQDMKKLLAKYTKQTRSAKWRKNNFYKY